MIKGPLELGPVWGLGQVQVRMPYCLLTPGTPLSPAVATVLHCCTQGHAIAAFPQAQFSSARCHAHGLSPCLLLPGIYNVPAF